MQQFDRMMNGSERAVLTQWTTDRTPVVTLGGTMMRTSFWLLSLFLSGFLIFAASRFVEQHPITWGLLLATAFIAAIGCLFPIALLWSGYIHWSAHEKRFQQVDVPEIKKALQDGMVTVRKVTASAVVELVEFEDEGGGYVFDIGDNQSLFLKGQHIFPASEEMPWPNSDFEIVRTIMGDRWVGIFCHGNMLTPIRSIELSDCREDVAWMSCEEVVEQSYESFATSLLAE